MIKENQLYVIFDPKFLEDIETLGNSVTISYYYLEDVRGDIRTFESLIDPQNNAIARYNNKPFQVCGFWDSDRKELKIHLGLGKEVYSNKVKSVLEGDPDKFEFDSYSGNEHDGNSLIRVIRFIYNDNKTAFIVTGHEKITETKILVEPIRCNQDKIILTVGFPNTTKANIKALKIEKDTEFLEGPGICRGENIFRTFSDELLASRHSAVEYITSESTKTKIEKKDTPYIDNSGRLLSRRDKFRIYTSLDIFCNNILYNIRPKTRASLNMRGGILKIYGNLKYLEYEARGTEFVYIGEGTEALDGLADSELILTEHPGGLKNPRIEDRFYISYGDYEGQTDPSVLVKGRVEFFNPFTSEVESIESENIRLTQEENVISQWEVIYRSSQYIEPSNSGDIPVYMFPWKAGGEHNFIIRTTFPDLRIDHDFIIEYSDQILEDYFKIDIERTPNQNYPITDYKITLTSLIDNLDPIKWLPIVNGESEVKLTTIRLRDYDYYESFYYVQSPKSESLELHDLDNNNIDNIILEYNQESAEYYPVAPEARTQDEIGSKNTWKIIESDPRLYFDSTYGPINTSENLEYKLSLRTSEISNTIGDIDLGKITIGRIKESESEHSFIDTEWRSYIGLYKISIPVLKRGMIRTISSTETILLEDINLYKIRVVCNGPFACWMERSQDYCFFDPTNNQPTYTNYYYSREFNNSSGIDVYIALHNTILMAEEPIEDGRIFFTVTNSEPSWGDGSEIPECFSDPNNLAECCVYRKGVIEPLVDYVDPKDAYVFLDPYSPTELRLRSSETPVVDRLQIIEDDTNNYLVRPGNFLIPTLSDSLTPVYTTSDNYLYHVQHIQNNNDLIGYYPISPCCIYRAHSYNHSDISKQFLLFRKALDPSFYISDANISGDTLYVNADPNISDSDRRQRIVIRSRYFIRNEDFRVSTIVNGSFNISSIRSEILDTTTNKYQFTIMIDISAVNSGGPRTLGDITIISRIYDLVNITSHSSLLGIPYLELTQNDIDEIVSPARMTINVVQLSGNEINLDIDVLGDSSRQVSNAGETRHFEIQSSIPINENILVSDPQYVSNISTEGFDVVIPSIVSGYTPKIPSEDTSYIEYTQQKDIDFNIQITPIDTSLSNYEKTFLFSQSGISKGFVFAFPNESPKLYLGNNSLSLDVNAKTTSVGVFLGLFNIESAISDGTKGTTQGINIETQNTFRKIVNDCLYNSEIPVSTFSLEFSQNTTGKIIDRLFTITYKDNGLTHKLNIIIKQKSESGNIFCNNDAYFLSNGYCIETENYEDNLGYFTFDTDLDIKTVSLEIPKSLYESYSFIYIGSSNLGGSYKTYKALIKLKPNLSNSTIENQIFSFVKNGEKLKNISIHQGFYCMKMCRPGSTNIGVYSGGILGNISSPFEIPSRSNLTVGDRKMFNLIITRSEPNPITGKYTTEEINFLDTNIPEVSNFIWTYTGESLQNIDTSSSDEFSSSSSIRGNNTNTHTIGMIEKPEEQTSNTIVSDIFTTYSSETKIIDIHPFLENIYTVSPKYYTTAIPIKVNVSIVAYYPYNDPLNSIYNETTTHNYTIYLLKRADKF